jgi:hypothetical protein
VNRGERVEDEHTIGAFELAQLLQRGASLREAFEIDDNESGCRSVVKRVACIAPAVDRENAEAVFEQLRP